MISSRIEAWQNARELTNYIYDITSSGAFSRDLALRTQIRRASISIISNIAEGFERGGNREFLHFLAIAKGSCGEVRSQLYIALDRKYISVESFDYVTEKTYQVSSKLAGFIRYLKKSKFKGNKFNTDVER